MKIVSIEIHNFGSYEGTTVLDTAGPDDKNVIVIGGKNGAGKTTLFTAIRVCIYGCHAFGYQAVNAFYIRTLYKLINNHAKLVLPASAHVQIGFTVHNGTQTDSYLVKRIWTCEKVSSVVERLDVTKNGKVLSPAEIADFETFITQLIPPDLFNLYFFDGEKIADFFLNEGGNSRIKNAFLLLCGYDTFEIMKKNFHRLSGKTAAEKEMVARYTSAKDTYNESKRIVETLSNQIEELDQKKKGLEDSLKALDKDYRKSGGVSKKHWDAIIREIESEEKKRGEISSWMKKIADDVLPFLIVRDRLADIHSQIQAEEDQEKTDYFLSEFQHKDTRYLLSQALKENNVDMDDSQLTHIVQSIAQKLTSRKKRITPIFQLSPDQKADVQHTISQILAFDSHRISEELLKTKNSIKRTQELRDQLEQCSIEAVHQYIEKKDGFNNEIKRLEQEKSVLEDAKKEAVRNEALTKIDYDKIQKEYEEAIKKDNIVSISAKALLMLDKLEDRLYATQIAQMEALFRSEINRLMRKSRFIDDIYIDEQFDIHIYRNETYTDSELTDICEKYSMDKLPLLLGEKAKEKILLLQSTGQLFHQGHTELLVEIDKGSLSNGEKQIFIMALYKSLMQLCRHEVPFIIDTPFARIDTEHRQNIVRDFFCTLKGQVFILSTNEEISQNHMEIMKDKILTTFTLENDDNTQTHVKVGQYFGRED
ncbi:MAG: AAA family ATPase [Clostridiales bacterium]|jgi:DNA sulfur modification protein DndD|nr:AAA family ATPase [Clostridiales bacterium]